MTNGDGKYDVLEVETRDFKGPRAFDLSGIPLHEDNETVIKERIFLDKADPNLLHDEMTVDDHALTRPWTVMKSYQRSAEPRPQWHEYICAWESKTVRDRRRDLSHQQRRLSDARQEGSGAAEPQYFPTSREVKTASFRAAERYSGTGAMNRRGPMRHRSLISTLAVGGGASLAAATRRRSTSRIIPIGRARWRRIPTPGVTGQPAYDQTKRLGPAQHAPLTPEAQAIMKASMEDQAKGGQGNYPTYICLSPGMPRMMTPYGAMEFVITPDTVHIFIEHVHDSRRIFTDGRDWPKDITPTLQGYSIGKWIDEDGDGKYDVLEVETRGFKGPRAFDASGMPLHSDNQSIVKERLSLDKTNPNVMLNEITTIDQLADAAVDRDQGVRPRPQAKSSIGRRKTAPKATAMSKSRAKAISSRGDGNLMPAKKGEAPPDLRYFNQKK